MLFGIKQPIPYSEVVIHSNQIMSSFKHLQASEIFCRLCIRKVGHNLASSPWDHMTNHVRKIFNLPLHQEAVKV